MQDPLSFKLNVHFIGSIFNISLSAEPLIGIKWGHYLAYPSLDQHHPVVSRYFQLTVPELLGMPVTGSPSMLKGYHNSLIDGSPSILVSPMG